jgi:hypothetical protein
VYRSDALDLIVLFPILQAKAAPPIINFKSAKLSMNVGYQRTILRSLSRLLASTCRSQSGQPPNFTRQEIFAGQDLILFGRFFRDAIFHTSIGRGDP